MNIAVYGKGGIGKSTIAANISAYLGMQGQCVMQIGCDPKHDSTLLLSGSNHSTVLEKMDDPEISASDFMQRGKFGVDCIEMGGPMPGVGCAGRGIIAGMKILDGLKIISEGHYDTVIYDILGDVVCGGFFEPLKSGCVSEFYIVTSGEFNSLFAANNLCKGYVNCRLAAKKIVLGGVIANCRGINNEEQIISSFCKMVNIPLICCIPRDARIEKSTFLGKPIVEMDKEESGYEDLVGKLKQIADYISIPDKKITQPAPVDLEELRTIYEMAICG